MSADDPNIGRLVASRYRLDELLGRGGFGSVYKGWDTQIGRDVAVKLLDVANRARSPQQTAELRERFRREAMAAGRINHRGIVTIYDFGIPDNGDEAYLVMELLEGHDLADELSKNGPLMPDRALALFLPVLEGLGRGHELGIVHKDIKPQNIFLTHPGTHGEALCLVDFGVARVVHEDKLTMTGLIVGTPQYMAPEYITDTLVTPALDVYQMALILAEVITGTPAVPIGESFVKSCNRHFTGDLDVPDELYEGEFGKLLKMALRPNPKERLPDALEFARRLALIDPSTITLDSQATMVFNRGRDHDTFQESQLFPSLRPEQASAELEREADDSSGQIERSPQTPLPMRPVTGPAEVGVAAPERVPARVGAGNGAPPVNVPSEQWEWQPESTAAAALDEARPAPPPPPPGGLGVVLAILTVLLLTVGAIVAYVMSMATKADVSIEVEPPPPALTIPPAPVPQKSTTEIEMLPAARTVRLVSEPAGAAVWIDGAEVGVTPREIELGDANSAELRLDGYEVAVVALQADIEPIKLVKSRRVTKSARDREPETLSAESRSRIDAVLEGGRQFDPETGQTTSGEPEAADPASKKFKRKPTPPVEKWNEPPPDPVKMAP